jgi:hypothetical protein
VFTPQQIASKGADLLLKTEISRAELLHKTNNLKGQDATQDKKLKGRAATPATIRGRSTTERGAIRPSHHTRSSTNSFKRGAAARRRDPLTLEITQEHNRMYV